jgi:hypothetical protein
LQWKLASSAIEKTVINEIECTEMANIFLKHFYQVLF